MELEGSLDLRGLYNVSPDARPGFEGITCAVTLETPEPKERVNELIDLAEAHCPVSDSLQHSVSVQTKVDVIRAKEQ